MQGVVKSLEKTVLKVHVTDWVDSFWEVHRSRDLTVSMGPVMLDSFHVPLIHNHDDFLFGASVNSSKQIFITLVYECPLKVGEEDVSTLNVPVDHVLIQTLFCVLGWLRILHSYGVFLLLISPTTVSLVLNPLVEIVRNIHPRFMEKSMPCRLIELGSEEIGFSSLGFGLFASILYFQTWFQKSEI